MVNDLRSHVVNRAANLLGVDLNDAELDKEVINQLPSALKRLFFPNKKKQPKDSPFTQSFEDFIPALRKPRKFSKLNS